MNDATPIAAFPAPLIPPHARPADAVLPLWRFVPAFVRNPLAVMPEAVYEQPMVRYDAGKWPTI